MFIANGALIYDLWLCVRWYCGLACPYDCVCVHLLGSAMFLLLFFLYTIIFNLTSIYTWVFLFMQLMRAYDTA